MSHACAKAPQYVALAIIATAILVGASTGQAATFTWDGGGGDDNWSTGLNWAGDAAPANPAANDDLAFAGSTRSTPNVDAPWSGVQSIGFTGATTAFTIGGNAVTLSGTGTISNATAFDHAINTNLVGGATALNVTQNADGNQLTFGGTVDLSAGGGLNITPTAGTVVFNGVISGGAAVTTNAGAGTVQLNAANTFTGGLNLDGGTLAVNADGNLGAAGGAMGFDGGTLQYGTGFTDSTRPVTLGAGGGTVDTNGNDAALQGAVDGAGALTKIGAGTLALGGANTYAGGTTVSGGTLQGTTTSLQGDVTNDAAVVFDQAADGTYAGVLSGTGTVTKSGAGTVTFSGANTYAGGTTVSGGTLQGTTTSLQGDVANDAAVVFDQAADGTYAGVLSGTGSVTKSGAGTVTFSGANTYSGGLNLNGGTLAVNADGNLGAAGGAMGFDGGTLQYGTGFT
ncbi:MAG: autotransporter-associated beta strand repeat-containing protein, partial [Phycisphaerae bacterium]